MTVLGLSLIDAANNCDRHDATAIITLRGSGVQYQGKLRREDLDAGNVLIQTDGGGWAHIEREEIAAVEVKPKEHF